MQLVFFTEERFFKDKDGLIYSRGGFSKDLWKRYLAVFDEVVVVARVGGSGEANPNYLTTQGGVSVVELPYYVGPIQYLKVARELKKKIKAIVTPGRVYICRVPGMIGETAAEIMRRREIPYGVEVVGDPWDVFAPGAVKTPFRCFFRCRGLLKLRACVKGASAALYVTESALQRRYPVSDGAYETVASNVVLPKSRIASIAKSSEDKPCFNILSIGSLEQMYKAPDILLKALKILKKRGFCCHLTWLGDGRHRAEMEMFALELGIADAVSWMGNVPASQVDIELGNANVFAMVSRTEGLPRALIEAMAKGLPCIGTTVGGIPELLNEKALIPPNDAVALADKLCEMFTNIEFANKQASRNLEKAKEYSEDVLSTRRNAFYQYLVSLIEK